MKARLRIEPLLVALVTLVPMAAAYWLYYSGRGADLPTLANEERRIVSPPVALPPLAAVDGNGREIENLWSEPLWSLIYVAAGPCADACGRDLTHLLQVHLSLGKDQDRVRRIYLGAAGGPPDGDPSLLRVRPDSAAARPLLERSAAAAEPAAKSERDSARLYVVDPHGNLVLEYPAGADRRGLREDLERLLKVSRIG
ncbi:MAG TPA: hypothetical protein VFV10_13730 [Gammaproteobacteria bacterium]|nr:hypothetical protein [Gammaproteobacteria bacterium]